MWGCYAVITQSAVITTTQSLGKSQGPKRMVEKENSNCEKELLVYFLFMLT